MPLRNGVVALVLFALSAFAQQSEPATPPADASATPAAAKPAEPIKNPLPADKSVPQTITVNGKTLHYTPTVGTIALKSKDEKTNAVVMYTAFTLDEGRGNAKSEGKGCGSHLWVCVRLYPGSG